MYFLYSLWGVTFNKCWITLSILNCYSPNFQGFILMKNALNNQMGMLGDMFLWLVANLKQGVIYFIKQALPPNISAGSVHKQLLWIATKRLFEFSTFYKFILGILEKGSPWKAFALINWFLDAREFLLPLAPLCTLSPFKWFLGTL